MATKTLKTPGVVRRMAIQPVATTMTASKSPLEDYTSTLAATDSGSHDRDGRIPYDRH
jgi:hypothetical protein